MRVGPFAFRYQANGATPSQYIDTTRKAIDCATTLLYNETFQQTFRPLLSKLSKRRQILVLYLHFEEGRGGIEPWLMARWKARVEFLLSVILNFFYRAPQCSHCKRCTSYGNFVCPYVCPSVRLSHAGIVSKRRHVARCSLHHQIAKCV